MNKTTKVLLAMIVAALFCFPPLTGFSEEGMTEENKKMISYPDRIVLSIPEGQKARKAEVQFPHQDHIMQFGCSECHHEWDHTEMNQPEACVSCHDDFADRRATESYYNAFHNRDSTHSCIGCHNQMTDESADINPPTRCSDCHPRPERE